MKKATTCIFLNFLVLVGTAQVYSDVSSNLPNNGAKGQSMDVHTVDIDGDEDLISFWRMNSSRLPYFQTMETKILRIQLLETFHSPFTIARILQQQILTTMDI